MPLVMAAAEGVLKWGFFGSLAIIGAGILLVVAAAAMMLVGRSGPQTADTTGTANAKTPAAVLSEIVTGFFASIKMAWNLFMNQERSVPERIIGLGVVLVLLGALLSIATGIAYALAALPDGGGAGDGSTTPTTTGPTGTTTTE
jgi:hypothetical protein